MAENLGVDPVGDMLATVASLLERGDLVAALDVAERDYADSPTAGGVCALAAIAYRQGNIASSIQLLETLVEGLEGASDIPEILAVLNCLAGRISEALYYGKLATVHPANREVIALFGPALPSYAEAFLEIEHKPLLAQSRAAAAQGIFDQAIHAVEQHLSLFREDVEGLDHYAQCLYLTGDFRRAVNTLRMVFTLAGPSATLSSRLGQALVALGEFEQGMACHRQAVARAPKAAPLWAAMVSDWQYSPWGQCATRDAATAGLTAAIAAAGPKAPRRPPEARDKEVLTVGFLCNAYRDLEQQEAIAAMAGGFDPTRVRVVGFGQGEMSAAANSVYRGHFQVWRDTAKIDELTLSALVRGEGVDVLIDADGLAARDRLSLMLRNAAPLQYSWLNMPADLALPGAHGNLAAQPGLAKAGVMPLRAARAPVLALPAVAADGAISLGADVSLAELNVEVVRTWAAILHAVPAATLVMVDRGFSAPEATDRLVQLFGNFGVAHRVDVVGCGAAADFFASIDIALSPFPVARPYPYGVALGLGVPVVGMAGAGLCAVQDEAHLLAADTDRYVERVVELASDLGALARLRAELAERTRAAAAYAPSALAAEWERFFRQQLAEMAAKGEALA